MRLYTEPDHPREKLFLNDEEYSRALQAVVRYCHDVLFVDTDKNFLLAERRPDNYRPGPWFIGGGVKPFTPTFDSLVHTILRETSLTIKPERFSFIGQHRYFFNGGSPELPQDALCDIFVVELSPQEIASVQLDTSEYVENSLKIFKEKDIQLLADPFVRQIFTDVWNDLH